jgi:FkbM family methyltransferase
MKIIKQLLNKYGYSVAKINVFTSSNYRLKKILQNQRIDLFIDVGANKGQFLKSQILTLGKTKTIIVEPIVEYKSFYHSIGYEKIVAIENKCISSKNDKIIFNIAQNDVCSSILLPTEYSKSVYTGLDVAEVRELETARLDQLIKLYSPQSERIFLKLDVQGTEIDALSTIGKYISQLSCIRIEASFTKIYEGQNVFGDIIQHELLKQYRIVDIDVVAANSKTGEVDQADITMIRC